MARLEPPASHFCRPEPRAPPARGSFMPGAHFPRVEFVLSAASFSNRSPAMLRMPVLPAGFIAPCLPTKTDKLPSGSDWLHEIKHDGFRVIARKNAAQVKLYSRPGNDLTYRFPLVVETLARLRSRSRIIDGEAVA
jgi:ATP-dependent DNA ligase